MYEPQFSVVIPTYNIVENEFVNDFDLLITLLSKQSYPFVEVIVMDNASKDGTADLLKEYKNDGLISFYSDSDNGKFDAMNKGIMRAKGKYISFLSCDDFYHDVTAIEDVVAQMEETEADFCVTPSNCVQEDGSVFVFEPDLLSTFQSIPCPRQAVVFKKETLEKLNMFDSKFKLLADYDMLIRLILSGSAGIVYNSKLVTTKLGTQVDNYSVQADAETSHIYFKNYRSLYPLNDELVERMVKLGEIPQELLNKFVSYFPEDSYDLFYQRYEENYNFKSQNVE